MKKGITVYLRGANIEETAAALGKRLIEMGRETERIDGGSVKRIGGGEGAAHVCQLLSRNGVVVVATYCGPAPEGACLDVEVAAHDTPDFAAEKVLDSLGEAEVIDLDSVDYSPEEEERIRERLANLGYIE